LQYLFRNYELKGTATNGEKLVDTLEAFVQKEESKVRVTGDALQACRLQPSK
jgi:hypothetical protein